MKWALTRNSTTGGSQVDLFHQRMADLFDDFFNLAPTGLREFDWVPALDMIEHEDAITVRVDVPGMDQKNLQVQLEGNRLVISGERETKDEREDTHKRIHVVERHHGSFSRSVELPRGFVAEKITAAYVNGVLTVTVPRNKKEGERRIPITVK